MSAHGKSESCCLAPSRNYRLEGAVLTPVLLRLREMETGHAAIKLADWRGLHASLWLRETSARGGQSHTLYCTVVCRRLLSMVR